MKKIILILVIALSLFGVDIAMSQNIPTLDETNISLQANNKVFGSSLFLGKFAQVRHLKFNPHYRINIGDKIQIMFWGAYDETLVVEVDSQGNIFIPKVGVIHVLGIEAARLNNVLQNAIRRVFKSNVYVYANVMNYQPISVFVAGNVKHPGLYEGLSSDDVIQFLDKAGGINTKDGSFRFIYVKRNNRVIKKIDLYDFLLNGHLELFQFENGDVIYVDSLKYYINVDGDVKRAYRFELRKPFITLKKLKSMALPSPSATNVIVRHIKNGKVLSNNISIKDDNYTIYSGDDVEFASDVNGQQIRVTVNGAIEGDHIIILERGTSLGDVLNKLNYLSIANTKAIQLYRKSVAKLQKELIESQLRDLEAKVFTTGSITTSGAQIRKEEAQLILNFIERARKIEPKGRVVLNDESNLTNVILEDEDIIYVPKKSAIITVQGEVKIPGAQTYIKGYTVSDYIKSVGGFTERADKEHVLVVRQNGKVDTYNLSSWLTKKAPVYPGDSILVLGKPNAENLQITKDIIQILYQIAVSAGVVIRIF